MTTFEPVPSRVSFPEQEERILDFWKQNNIFRRSIDERPEDRVFTFYEGPPTANGNPGIHHVLARVFKDLVPRYRTMRGYRVPRKGGWDTHGLPVELEVEKALGLSSKQEIEAYGVEAFNQQCRDSVFRYVQAWERMTDRIGFWIDMSDAYVTYSPEFVESGWWIFKRLWDNGLVFRDFRVTPHCPRCQTSLSSHEIAQGYKDNTPDPGVTLRFRLPKDADAPSALRLSEGVPTSLLAWTTTPWTLSGNTALAVAPHATYALVEREDAQVGHERVIVAEPLVKVAGEGAEVLVTFPGTALLGLEYVPLYDAETWEGVDALAFVGGRAQRVAAGELPKRRVIPSDEVTTDEGTGILHSAPAFGEADYAMGREQGLMFLQPVRLDGTLIGGPGDGLFAKQADAKVRADLRERGLLFKDETIHHTYPFCWRCDAPVLYYAKPSWYIRTTAVRDSLVANNEQIHWVPDHIQEGRFGEWLAGNIDWAVSRERYWGTPLPIWVCELCDHIDVIGSYEELFARALPGTADAVRTASGGVDPHRPFIDRVLLGCPQCGGSMRRTPEVADAWFDSGAMPYGQSHYPFEGADSFTERFPADFICEAVDQTRGWFYTLHALATLLNRTEDVPEGIAFRNVICLGHILDGEGQKMSKSRGNVVDPWTILNNHGADATRWYMYTASPPGNARRFSADLVAETSRKFISTLWNTYSFFVTYANTAGFDPASVPPLDRSELDRWIRSELHLTVQKVTAALDEYEPAEAARPIEAFVDTLSNWYVRRSRRRFWRSGDDADSQAALHTLYECLVTVSKLLAPFTPFLAEALHQNLVAGRVPGARDSVHLEDWPAADESAIDLGLSADVALVQRMVSLGRGARAKAQTKVRQPLARAILVPRNAAEVERLARFADQVADELNVKVVEVMDDPGDRLNYSLRPNLPVLGPKFGAEVGKVRQALAAADPVAVVRAMRAGQPVDLGGYTLAGSDILVGVEATEGWAAAEESGYAALVDTTVTAELHAEGIARELVRRIQDLRRDAGLEVSDRIRVAYQSDDLVRRVMAEHHDYIAGETLALAIEDVTPPSDATRFEGEVEGSPLVVAVLKA
ncbi:MAG: isoleucine--tRNA ligase [Dehalococcoidia bacterium]|nr:isoleucine--tRNA ligase [Dehalococcoidia bacterium]